MDVIVRIVRSFAKEKRAGTKFSARRRFMSAAFKSHAQWPVALSGGNGTVILTGGNLDRRSITPANHERNSVPLVTEGLRSSDVFEFSDLARSGNSSRDLQRPEFQQFVICIGRFRIRQL
jgi:hypothetical protein